jgi:hypothetical protein
MVAAEYEAELAETVPAEVAITEVGLDVGDMGEDSARDNLGDDDKEVVVDEFVITSGLDAGNDFDLSDAEFDEIDSEDH